MKQCGFCGNDFDNPKSKTLYCSSKCRTYAFRLRKKELIVAGTTPESTFVTEVNPKKPINHTHQVPKIKNAKVGQSINKQMPKGLSLQQQIDWKINNLK